MILRPPPTADDAVRAAVLGRLVDLYPAWLADEEVVRAVGPVDEEAGRRALRDLAADGLVHRRGGFVLPSRPAVACCALLGELSP